MNIWENIKLPEFQKLDHDIKTDVLIIGGGITGLLCAHFLKENGVDYVLVEGDKIASGTTKNTTAKITLGHSLIYDKLIKTVGKEKAQMYLNANLDAIKEYEKLCKNCDYEHQNSYTYSMTDRTKIENEIDALNSLGFKAEFKSTNLPFKTKGAVFYPDQAQFNPLKFVSQIAENLNIYEQTFIRDITPHSAISDTGKITAKKIIVATHFPFINKHGSYFVKLYQHRSYEIALENASVDGMYVDEDKKGMSFRNYGNYLLVGGGGHRTGKQGGAWKETEGFAKKYYPKSQPKYKWAAQDCMSLDGVPYIGQYSVRTPDLYVATGFNKWGMTSAMISAKILTDMILGRQNENTPVFSPSRSILKPQLFANGIETTINLLTPTPKRCPHLGCALKWNKAEHTWDCPCHGSRFDADGKLIDNPATGDANV